MATRPWPLSEFRRSGEVMLAEERDDDPHRSCAHKPVKGRRGLDGRHDHGL
jgi:hypothetical protein